MGNVYLFFRSFTDPLAFVLLSIGAGLWILKDLRKDHSKRLGWWILVIAFSLLYLLSISPVVSSFANILERDFLI